MTDFQKILETKPGDWINDDFKCGLRAIKTGTSQYGDWSSGFAFDPNDSESSIHFFASRNLEALDGEIVRVYGKGIKMEPGKDGKGPSLKMGSKALFEPIGAPPPSTSQQNAVQTPSNAVQSAPSAREESIYMQVAFKEACANYRALIASKEIKGFDVQQETAWIWDATSRLYRILKVVIDGKLAPKNQFEGAEMPEELTGEKGEEL